MTVDDYCSMGEKSLTKFAASYAAKLKDKFKGTKAFDESAKTIEVRHEKLGSLDEREIEAMVDDVIQTLLHVDGGFVMSEPKASHHKDVKIARHNYLNLTFACDYAATNDTTRLIVRCWYFPS